MIGSCVGRRALSAGLLCAGGVKFLFESCARSRARLILSILRCGVGLARADSLLRVCGGGFGGCLALLAVEARGGSD